MGDDARLQVSTLHCICLDVHVTLDDTRKKQRRHSGRIAGQARSEPSARSKMDNGWIDQSINQSMNRSLTQRSSHLANGSLPLSLVRAP